MTTLDNTIRVGISGNALVASFLTADAPRVWRTDMARLLTAALEVQSNQGKYMLVMKRSDAPVEEIATFSNKEEAVRGLQLITEALLEGNDGSAFKKSSPVNKALKILLKTVGVLFALFILLNILVFAFGRHMPPPGSNAAGVPATQTGVPTPADDVLGK